MRGKVNCPECGRLLYAVEDKGSLFAVVRKHYEATMTGYCPGSGRRQPLTAPYKGVAYRKRRTSLQAKATDEASKGVTDGV